MRDPYFSDNMEQSKNMTNEDLDRHAGTMITVRFKDGSQISGVLFRDSLNMPEPWYLNKLPTPEGYKLLKRFSVADVESIS